MLLVDAAGKENEVDGNTWFSPKGAESMSYLWAGQRGEGFAALRQASGWEAAGKFAEWTLKLPAEITSQQP